MKTQEYSINQVKQHGFIVGSIDLAGSFSIASKPISHGTRELAKAECERLAAMYPGKAFFYAQLLGGVVQTKFSSF